MKAAALPPFAQIFLLLPENAKVIRGETRRIGVTGEAAALRRSQMRLTAVLLIDALLTLVLFFLSPASQITNAIIGLIPAIFLAIILFRVRSRHQCLLGLEAVGILLPGQIVAAKADMAITPNGTKMVLRIRYELISPQGRRLEREEAQLRNEPQQLPEAGTPVAVMYTSDDCFRVL